MGYGEQAKRLSTGPRDQKLHLICYVSFLQLVYSDLEPSGQITLARAHHARASQYSFSASNKRALKVWFKTANGVDFETWNVDLRFSAERGRTPRTPEGRSSGKATKHSGNGMEQSGKGTEQSGNGRELSGTQKSGTDLISRLEQRTYISGTYAAVVAGK